MNTKTYFAVSAFALLAAGSVFAAEGTQDFANQVLSTKSRAEVMAAIHTGSAQYIGDASVAPEAVSTLPRAVVVAEAREALRLGLLGASERVPQPTAAQLEQIRVAGERAVAMSLAKAK
jgi:hypothetical protein